MKHCKCKKVFQSSRKGIHGCVETAFGGFGEDRGEKFPDDCPKFPPKFPNFLLLFFPKSVRLYIGVKRQGGQARSRTPLCDTLTLQTAEIQSNPVELPVTFFFSPGYFGNPDERQVHALRRRSAPPAIPRSVPQQGRAARRGDEDRPRTMSAPFVSVSPT